ncbi:uncharacterized protein LOC134945856 [Pseudophryne corroboree]|uniref:uncharacterized protein LOC134945856 n=1 Tax=Pseudophryne corroboree TaxID=495146 RepID=UPI003081CA4B
MQPPADCDVGDPMRRMLSQYMSGTIRGLQGHGVRRVCLQLFGQHGHGKSSLINSCLCVVQDCKFSNVAGAGGSGKPFTMARKEYKLADTVYIIDNRGLNQMNTDENLEVAAQLRKLRALGTVDWEFELERTVNLLENRYKNQSMDFIVPVFVLSVKHPYPKTLSNLTKAILPFLRDAFEITGVFPIVVLTNYKDQNISKMCRAMEDLGAQHIFALDNYTTSNSTRNVGTDTPVLRFLHACLQEADRGIQKRQNLDAQLEVIRQSVSQIQSEMSRQKEIEMYMKEESRNKRRSNGVQALRGPQSLYPAWRRRRNMTQFLRKSCTMQISNIVTSSGANSNQDPQPSCHREKNMAVMGPCGDQTFH